jgi:hypothetical protein
VSDRLERGSLAALVNGVFSQRIFEANDRRRSRSGYPAGNEAWNRLRDARVEQNVRRVTRGISLSQSDTKRAAQGDDASASIAVRN